MYTVSPGCEYLSLIVAIDAGRQQPPVTNCAVRY